MKTKIPIHNNIFVAANRNNTVAHRHQTYLCRFMAKMSPRHVYNPLE